MRGIGPPRAGNKLWESLKMETDSDSEEIRLMFLGADQDRGINEVETTVDGLKVADTAPTADAEMAPTPGRLHSCGTIDLTAEESGNLPSFEKVEI